VFTANFNELIAGTPVEIGKMTMSSNAMSGGMNGCTIFKPNGMITSASESVGLMLT
jgi:hypothetical protein